MIQLQRGQNPKITAQAAHPDRQAVEDFRVVAEHTPAQVEEPTAVAAENFNQ